MRSLLHRRYQRGLTRIFLRYLHQEHSDGERIDEEVLLKEGLTRVISVSRWTQLGKLRKVVKKRKRGGDGNRNLGKDIQVEQEALSHASKSTWWNWDAGSTLFFWR